MLNEAEAAFNNVAALVICGIKCWWAAAACATAFSVSDLIRRLGNHRGDAPPSQQGPSRSTRIGPVAADTVGTSTWPTGSTAIDFQMGKQMLEHRAVVGLARAHQYHQRTPGPVDEVVDLAGQSAAGAANPVVRRLYAQIRVIRPSPLCGG